MKASKQVYFDDNIEIIRFDQEDSDIVHYGIYDAKQDEIKGGQREFAYLTVHVDKAMNQDYFTKIIEDFKERQ